MEISNAKITKVTLGYEDQSILTFGLVLEIAGGCGCVYGGYALDSYDKEKKKRILNAKSMECLTEIMRVVGVRNWEDLNGKYIRVKIDGLGSPLTTIGNIMEEKWFDIKEFFRTED